MNDLQYMNKPYDTKKYEKFLSFSRLPFLGRLFNTFKYAVLGFILSLSLSVIIFLFDFITYFFNLIASSEASILSFGVYLVINIAVPVLAWIYGFLRKEKKSAVYLANSIEKQKYLVNRLIELYNNRLKLLEYLGSNTSKGFISDKETLHLKSVLEKISPKISEMKRNIEINSKSKEFLSKYTLEQEGLYNIIEELKHLDDQISQESRETLEKYIDDAYIFEAFDNIEKEMRRMDIDSTLNGIRDADEEKNNI